MKKCLHEPLTEEKCNICEISTLDESKTTPTMTEEDIYKFMEDNKNLFEDLAELERLESIYSTGVVGPDDLQENRKTRE